jgi:hypothetical protein
MIEKEKALLDYHSSQLRSCTDAMRTCMTDLENEKKGREECNGILHDLNQRKTVADKMVRSVTKKIMRLRRRREIRPLKGNS